MDIEIGKLYENKTWGFLIPITRVFGETFVNKFNLVFKLAVGIADDYVPQNLIGDDRCLFILIDSLHRPNLYEDFINWVQYQDYFKGQYVSNTAKGADRKVTIMLKIPEKYHHAYDMFLEGSYSKMYTEEEIDIFFNRPDQIDIKKLLTKSPSLHEDFITSVNKLFGTTISSFDEPVKEYALPLVKKEEVFNTDSAEFLVINRHETRILNL